MNLFIYCSEVDFRSENVDKKSLTDVPCGIFDASPGDLMSTLEFS